MSELLRHDKAYAAWVRELKERYLKDALKDSITRSRRDLRAA